MRRKYTYSDYESKFIIKNYPISGSKFILKNLEKISEKSLDSFIYLNKLKIIRPEIKIDLNDKYLCYVLGLMWADGNVSLSDRNRVSFKILEDDIINIKDIVYNVCDWKYQLDISENLKWKNSVRLSFSDKKFKLFLIENDYLNKSSDSPSKILSLIPDINRKYFFRGLFDGDGCFFYKKYKNGNLSRVASITSTYDQDWSSISNMLNSIGCKFTISKVINNKEKNHRSSVLKISSSDIIRFGKYLYEDNFGLSRKFKKYLEIKESYLYKKCIKE